jgi:lipopolysaccharide/colanic/teichoic acid biosynthesis glycosyltransferase
MTKNDKYSLSKGAAIVKRAFDITGALIALILFSLVFLIIIIAIKSEDHGPAIFKQKRIGYKGKIFTLYKFRSMIVSAEKE